MLWSAAGCKAACSVLQPVAAVRLWLQRGCACGAGLVALDAQLALEVDETSEDTHSQATNVAEVGNAA